MSKVWYRESSLLRWRREVHPCVRSSPRNILVTTPFHAFAPEMLPNTNLVLLRQHFLAVSGSLLHELYS